MAGPNFEYVAVLGDDTKAKLRVVSLQGLSTKHADANTDRGRLYGTIARVLGVFHLKLYADVGRNADKLVAAGTTEDLGAYFDLAEQNGSGITGRAWLDSYNADYAGLVVVPTFAVDQDVFIDQPSAAGLGQSTYDATYGLGYYHAQAVRTILTSALPAALPHLYGGLGAAAFVPTMDAGALPDLRTLANVDQLREAQGQLVKFMAACASEHLEGFAAIRDAAWGRYLVHIDNLKAANAQEQPKADEVRAGVSTSTWTRG